MTLVENQDFRIVHERVPPAACVTLPVIGACPMLRVGEIYEAYRAIDCALVFSRRQASIISTNRGLQNRNGLVLGHDADAPGQLGIVAHRAAKHCDCSTRRFRKTGHHAEQSGLPRSIGAKQSGNSRRHVERDVADCDNAAKPARHMIDPNNRGGCPIVAHAHADNLL